VAELSAEEREQLGRVPFDESAFASSIGVTATPGEPGRSLLERLWARPTLDVNGFGGGFQGEGLKTIIPAQAFAKISCRLVPNQDPERILDLLARRLEELAPPGARVEVERLGSASWALSSLDSAPVRAAAEAILAELRG